MAREYAQQAITQHQSGMTFLKLASKLDAVRSRMESAKASKQMVPMMSKTVASMDVALQQMDVVKITSTMDKFEEQFGELDVRTGYMNQAMGSVTAALTPEDEIDSLMQQVADEHGLELAKEIDAAGAVPCCSNSTTARSNLRGAGRGHDGGGTCQTESRVSLSTDAQSCHMYR